MRAQTKTRKIKLAGESTDDIAKIFDGIINGDKVPLAITYPRYVKMLGYVKQIYALHERLRDCALLKHPSMSGTVDSLRTYMTELSAFIADSEAATRDMDDYVDAWDLIEPEQHMRFHDKYTVFKQSVACRALFKSLSAIIDYRRDFMSKDENRSIKSKLGFIMTAPGGELSPFPFTWNLCETMQLDGVGANTWKWLIAFLTDYYTSVNSLWLLTQEPDADIDKFTTVITQSIEGLRKIPELNRCHTAFSKITSSIGLFRENFAMYYRNFVESKNSSTIMHEFVIDVMKTTDTNPSLTREFRTIVNYYTKVASQQSQKDPKLKALFDKLGKALNNVDSGADDNKLRNIAREDHIAARSTQRAAAPTTTPTAASAANPSLAAMTPEEIEAFVMGNH